MRWPQFSISRLLLFSIPVGAIAGALFMFGSAAETCACGSPESRSKLKSGAIESAIKLYALDVGEPPATSDGLSALLNRPAQLDELVWDGPYVLDDSALLDEWDQPFRYEFPTARPGVSFAIWSVGPDGIDGTDDDLVNWR